MIDLLLRNRTKDRLFTKAFVARVCNAVEPRLKIPKGHRAEIGITLIGPTAMRALNRNRRKVDAVTDVLSFPLHMKPIPGYTAVLLGDCFICPSIVRAKAVELGQSAKEYAAWTIVHGLLHLAGYDHAHMHEERIVKTLHL